jgi:hypothetical protein
MTIAIVSSLLVSAGILLSPSSEAEGAARRQPTFEARREEIFQTLRGGDAELSRDVTAHLWKLAGELAHSEWTPPRMRVKVVVRPLG